MSREYHQPSDNADQELGFYTDKDGSTYMLTAVSVNPQEVNNVTGGANVTGVSTRERSLGGPSAVLRSHNEEPRQQLSTLFDPNSDDISASGFEVASPDSGPDTVPTTDVSGSTAEQHRLTPTGDGEPRTRSRAGFQSDLAAIV